MRVGFPVAVCAAALAVAGCAGASQKPAPGPARAAVAAASPSCQSQFATWRSDTGGTDASGLSAAVAANESAVRAALRAGDSKGSVAALSQAASNLQAVAQAAAASPPPACVPGLRADAGAAMSGFASAAQDEIGFAQDVAAGDVGAANAATKAFVAQFSAAAAALASATADESAFTG